MASDNLTAARVREVLSYDPDTGVFTWKVKTTKKVVVGAVAGSVTSHGYIEIGIDGERFYAHRLAVLHVTGEWPKDDVDHRLGVRCDNRYSELRDATKSFNLQNQRRPKKNNAAGFLGVHKVGKRFRASIEIDGKTRHLGYHDTPELAHAAYLQSKRQQHEGCTL